MILKEYISGILLCPNVSLSQPWQYGVAACSPFGLPLTIEWFFSSRLGVVVHTINFHSRSFAFFH